MPPRSASYLALPGSTFLHYLLAAARARLRAALLAACASFAWVAAALPVASSDEAIEARRSISEVRDILAGAADNCSACEGSATGSRPKRIFIDGVFDLTHYGHMNAFRQARALGGYLIVGVNSDESVKVAKGSLPVLNDAERQAAVAACRFVDEIIPAAPYVMTEEYINYLVEDQGIDYIVHGDDPCIVNGRDVYESARKAGRFRSIPRTEGISTTDIVGRLLLETQDHHTEILDGMTRQQSESGVFASQQSKFLVTSQLLRAFSGMLPGKKPAEAKVVYVDGAWDMFHSGHISLLQKAHDFGDFVIVGVHADNVVNRHRGANFPIMNMQERVLSVVGCRHVDDVLLDAPWSITREMIASLGISVVVRGTVHDAGEQGRECCPDPHEVAKELGIHRELPSQEGLSLNTIAARLQSRHEEWSERQQKKAKAEETWYKQKHGLS
eukprot:TRINITY_DN51551_c0_g1_i1.p1 TRINITY_DN51551_c0_g1~~TRINITY_DN51551_c0_g1_i1.p1  ORF type:complete len:469 (-),score=92.89 TRINITY_DN51551_c0_g1_i1:137-1465(-)